MSQSITAIWNRLAAHPWLTMIFAVAAQTWFTLGNRALWFSDEVRYANAYQNLVQHGKWIVLSLNGQPYPDKPPVYFWFLWLLDTLTPANMPEVFFLGAALSGLFFVASAYILARTLGYNKDICLATILILLSNFLLIGLFHYSRMDLMFASFIVLSHACLFKAFSQEKQGRYPLYAFILAGVATLIKGPLGFIFPLLTVTIYLLWKSEAKKLFTRQMGLGLGAMLAMLLAWVAGVMIAEGPSFLFDTVLGKHILQRATKTFHHREPFYYYLIAFPLSWLPWTLFAGVAPIKKLFSLGYWNTCWSERRTAGPHAFLWILFVSIFIFLSLLSGKVLIYILPMFPPLAILTAHAMHSMDNSRTARFWTMVAGLWCALGLGLIVAGDLLPFPVPIRGLGITACVLLAGSGLLFFVRTRGFKGGLLCLTLAVTIWLYPIGLMVAPSLDEAMSPERTALAMGEYAKKGYTPMAFNIYSGIFTYYAEQDIVQVETFDEITDRIKNGENIVLVIRDKYWKQWTDRPEGFTVIGRQTISGMTYLLVVRD